MRRTDTKPEVIGGVDTHKDMHVAVAVDSAGRLLGTAEFSASPPGYRRLLAWLRRFGRVSCVGVEATGSYGIGLARFLRAERINVVEVIRPNRQLRRRRGKSDPVDAESAARAALAGEGSGEPKSAEGVVEAMRMIRLARASAIKARTQAANQLHALVETAPEDLRERLRSFTIPALVQEAQRWRPRRADDPFTACRTTIGLLARRWSRLQDEISSYDHELRGLTQENCPELLEQTGIGPEVASCLLVAAGDNPERLRSESSFAALCGVSPLDASSGRQQRHRLNRGGNRQANRALWVIAMTRLRVDARTHAYLARRTQEGLTRPEILRCLKRYIAREVYFIILRSLGGRAST